MSRAYGWKVDGKTAEPKEADEARRWATYILDDTDPPPSWKGLAADLHARGVKTVSGKAWSGIVIRRILTAPRMIGKRFDDSGALVDTDVEPILTEEIWRQLRAELITEDRQKFTPSRSTVYLLSGRLAICGGCGHAMSYNTAGDRAAVYGCTIDGGGCGRITINAGLIEADVTERVLARLTDEQYRQALGRAMDQAGTADDQRTVISDLRTRLATLGTDYGARLIERATLLAGTESVRAGIAAAERMIRAADALADIPGPTVDDVLAWWEEAPAARQHDIVAVLLDHVTVRSSEGRTVLGADRLEFVWHEFQ